MENNQLIYDIGLHLGYDTQMYLEKGYRVVAVEANPLLVDKARKKFKNDINSGRLEVLNYAIAELDDSTIPFYISINRSIQSSLQKNMAERGSQVQEIQVKTIKLSTLFENYGIPHYCKIDIEGYDYIALKSLEDRPKHLSKFISAEINNVGMNGETAEDIDDISELQQIWLSILIKLQEIGYKKFRVIDQGTLQIIAVKSYVNSEFYFKKSIISRIYNKYLRIKTCLKYNLSLNVGYSSDCSGPFGGENESDWTDFEQTKNIIIHHGNCMLRFDVKTMWCDIHATF
jgi:FkbM family methyltransferase